MESRILRRLEVERGLLMLEEGHSVCQTLPKDDHSFTGVYLCMIFSLSSPALFYMWDGVHGHETT
jgi:hypothetical protein